MLTREEILEIHQKPKKIFLAITGGGSEVIGHLLKYGQGSNTLIGSVVPYEQKEFDEFVKGKPDKYCSPEAARDLAMASFQKAVANQGIINAFNLIGIGATCSLAKDHEREGRKHHAYIAVQTHDKTHSYSVNLTGEMNREEEERYVAEAVVSIIRKEKGLDSDNKYFESEEFVYDYSAFDLISGKSKLVKVKDVDNSQTIVFAGSFNPLHSQHITIAEKTSELTGKKIDFEICVHNADKPALNYFSLRDRKVAMMKELANKKWFNNLIFTALPTFKDKAMYFKNTTFIIGWDTFTRLGDPKYGNLDEVMKTFEEQNTKFLVFHRIVDGKPSWENPQEIYEPLIGISKIIPPEELPLIEISSSQIRKTQRLA